MRSKITERTRGIIVINPNNPTGAVYDRSVLEGIVELAREHDLIIYSDEIYEKILYDDAVHVPISSLTEDLFCVTFSGLSKAYRAAGFRAGWMVLTGDKSSAGGYLEGVEMLSNMRLCSNVPAQLGIETALGGYQSINELIRPGGRLREQRDLCHTWITSIPGVTCVKPRGALYMFPKLDVRRFGIADDMKFAMELLQEEKVLVVHGSGFNWPHPDHFRMVFLPALDDLKLAIDRIGRMLQRAAQRVWGARPILGAAFMKLTGTKFLEVPYRGSSAAFPDLLAGRVDLFVEFDPRSVALHQIRPSQGHRDLVRKAKRPDSRRADHDRSRRSQSRDRFLDRLVRPRQDPAGGDRAAAGGDRPVAAGTQAALRAEWRRSDRHGTGQAQAVHRGRIRQMDQDHPRSGHPPRLARCGVTRPWTGRCSGCCGYRMSGVA